jgi:hypothetical protein
MCAVRGGRPGRQSARLDIDHAGQDRFVDVEQARPARFAKVAAPVLRRVVHLRPPATLSCPAGTIAQATIGAPACRRQSRSGTARGSTPPPHLVLDRAAVVIALSHAFSSGPASRDGMRPSIARPGAGTFPPDSCPPMYRLCGNAVAGARREWFGRRVAARRNEASDRRLERQRRCMVAVTAHRSHTASVKGPDLRHRAIPDDAPQAAVHGSTRHCAPLDDHLRPAPCPRGRQNRNAAPGPMRGQPLASIDKASAL